MAAEGWRIASFLGLLAGAVAISSYASWSYLTWPKAGAGERHRAKRVVARSAILSALLGSPIATYAFVYGNEPTGGAAAGAGPAISPWLWIPGLIVLGLLGGLAWARAEHKFVAMLEPEGEAGTGDYWIKTGPLRGVLILTFLFWAMAIMAASMLHG